MRKQIRATRAVAVVARTVGVVPLWAAAAGVVAVILWIAL